LTCGRFTLKPAFGHRSKSYGRALEDPAQHQRWDARFTSMRSEPGQPQPFSYRVTVLPWLTVGGVGVCVGERRRPDGTRTSALRFAGRHRLALIGSGSGYWRYVPIADGVRFVTGYDYTPSWGRFGRVADVAFRPVLGWATAWSFDRLRLWLEDGLDPAAARRRSIRRALNRMAMIASAFAIATIAAGLVTAIFVTIACACLVAIPPPPTVPSARRCRRRPARRADRSRIMADAPATLARLELR
jgi:hypothetical protein